MTLTAVSLQQFNFAHGPYLPSACQARAGSCDVPGYQQFGETQTPGGKTHQARKRGKESQSSSGTNVFLKIPKLSLLVPRLLGLQQGVILGLDYFFLITLSVQMYRLNLEGTEISHHQHFMRRDFSEASLVNAKSS